MSDFNVRRVIGKPLDEVTKDFFDGGDTNSRDGWFTGKVVNNNDPDKEGKCQIRVFGIFGPDLPDSDIPWALPDFNFIGSKLGSFVVPPVDAIVKVYFDHGDIYLPHYSTKAVVKSSQPSQKDTDYPDNMVMFETDDGDYFTMNRKTKETTFNHNSGTKITIAKDGSIEINSKGKIDIKHTNILTIDGKSVIPNMSGQGSLCSLPFCLMTGTPHVGSQVVP